MTNYQPKLKYPTSSKTQILILHNFAWASVSQSFGMLWCLILLSDFKFHRNYLHLISSISNSTKFYHNSNLSKQQLSHIFESGDRSHPLGKGIIINKILYKKEWTSKVLQMNLNGIKKFVLVEDDELPLTTTISFAAGTSHH